MRRTGDVVAQRLGRGFADKQAACIADISGPLVRVLDDQCQVLRRIFVGDRQRIVETRNERESATIAQGVERDLPARQVVGLFDELPGDLVRQCFAGRNQDRGCKVVVFGLGEQVGGEPARGWRCDRR